MSEEEGALTRTLLEEIRDNQKLQIQRQDEALELQRRQIALVERQFERSEKLQERAERLQEKSGQLMERGRKVFMIVIPVLFVLLVYVSWLLFF
jgi:uncharacterized membrane protein (DUF106 family)